MAKAKKVPVKREPPKLIMLRNGRLVMRGPSEAPKLPDYIKA